MAETLEEFLVSLKFGVDEGGYHRFLDTIKRISLSLGGVAAEIVGLTTLTTVFADKMAKTGDTLYWMSQRLGDSISTLQTTAQAMSTLGMTSGEAYANMEKFGFWMRSYGPAATGFLRTLGVTANDTKTAMDQLARTLYARGLRPGMEGSAAYAYQLQYLGLMPGMTEQFVRTAGQREQREAAMRQVGAMVWGGQQAMTSGLQRFGNLSQGQMGGMMLQFGRLEALFTNIAEKMALNIFPAVSKFIDEILANGPTIADIFDHIGKGLGIFVGFVGDAVKMFHELPEAIKIAVGVFLTFPSAIRILMSPLGMVIAGFTALFLLMDDYKHYQADIARGLKDHPHSQFDWGDETMFGAVAKGAKWLEKFAEDNPVMVAALAGIAALVKSFGTLKTAALLAGRASLLGPIGAAIGAAVLLHKFDDPATIEAAKKQFGEDTTANRIKAIINDIVSAITGEDPDEIAKRNWQRPLNQANPGFTAGIPGLPGGPSGPPSRLHPPRKGWWGPNFLNPEYWNNPQLGGQHSELTQGYQLASIGDSWMPPSAFGGGGSGSDSSLFRMLRDALDTANEKLGDIVDTLSDMATGLGSPTDARAAGRGYAGAGGQSGQGDAGPTVNEDLPSDKQDRAAMLMKKVMAELGINQNEAAPIVSAFMRESGGFANISRGGGPFQLGTGIDVGLAQWVGSRHVALEAFARSIQSDPRLVDTQIKFLHHELQTNPAFRNWLDTVRSGNPEAFGDLYEAGGKRSWYNHGNYINMLRRMNLGGGGGGGGNTYNTSITVNGSGDPHETGRIVGQHVDRTLQDHARYTTNAYA
jgi:hypothetical protein